MKVHSSVLPLRNLKRVDPLNWCLGRGQSGSIPSPRGGGFPLSQRCKFQRTGTIATPALWPLLQMVSPLEGGLMSPLRVEPGRTTWAKVWPPGGQATPRPGSRREEARYFTSRPGDFVSFMSFIIRGLLGYALSGPPCDALSGA